MRMTLPERFWSKVDKGDGSGCWLWTPGGDGGPYGRIRIAKRDIYAHRMAWELSTGAAPGALYVLHKCDTPLCVRPDHLFLGTHADNMRDKQCKGRASRMMGEEHGCAKLTDEVVVQIRKRRASGMRAADIARDYGVSQFTIYDVVSRRTWTHVP